MKTWPSLKSVNRFFHPSTLLGIFTFCSVFYAACLVSGIPRSSSRFILKFMPVVHTLQGFTYSKNFYLPNLKDFAFSMQINIWFTTQLCKKCQMTILLAQTVRICLVVFVSSLFAVHCDMEQTDFADIQQDFFSQGSFSVWVQPMRDDVTM